VTCFSGEGGEGERSRKERGRGGKGEEKGGGGRDLAHPSILAWHPYAVTIKCDIRSRK